MSREEIPREKETVIQKGLGSFILVAFSWIYRLPLQRGYILVKTLQGKRIRMGCGGEEQQKQTGETEVPTREK